MPSTQTCEAIGSRSCCDPHRHAPAPIRRSTATYTKLNDTAPRKCRAWCALTVRAGAAVRTVCADASELMEAAKPLQCTLQRLAERGCARGRADNMQQTCTTFYWICLTATAD